jgi:hypothetical protein
MVLCVNVLGSEYWSTNKQKFTLSNQWNLKLVEEFRMYSDTLNTYVQYSGLTRTLNDNVDISLWHKLVFSRNERSFDKYDLIVGDIAFKTHKVFNRHRIESGLGIDILTYRNKIKRTFSNVFGWTPYIAEELFFNLNESNLFENRLSVGMSKAPWSFSYLFRQKRQSSGWDASDIIMFGYSIKF